MKISEKSLLDVLAERAPRAVHAAELGSRLGIPKNNLDDLLRVLDRLRDTGCVKEMPGKRYRFVKREPERGARTPAVREPSAPATRRKAEVTNRERFLAPPPPYAAQSNFARVRGVLELHPRGFGFVYPDDGGKEVFVPRDYVGPALHGDRVEVDAQPTARGRDGRVVGIVERRRAFLVGTVHGVMGRGLVFAPGDPKLPETMRIVEALPADVAVGDAVLASIVGYPQGPDDPVEVIVRERLGSAGELGVEVARVLAREGVVEEFSEDVAAEAKRVPKKVVEEEHRGRRDLRELPLVTIDPDDARDHDDALFASRTERGYRIVVAIADVSHYVRPGTAIDAEAIARATSIYLPTRAIPMLPREISSRIASLLPGEDRLCMGADVELAEDGRVLGYSLFEGVMRSRARITYGGAARALGLTTEVRTQKEAEAHVDTLRVLLEASRKLRARRDRRGSLDFDLPEAKIVFGDGGRPVDVVESRGDAGVREAYRLVEEMMLLANELVAEHLSSRHIPAIHRLHPPPDARKLEAFGELARALGHPLELDGAVRPKPLARFLAEVEGTREAPFLRHLLLRAMQQASYGLDDTVGHFGLAARHYLHFTSPIRRYPDLAVHRVLRAHLRGERIDVAALLPKLRMQALESSRLERRAMSVDRDVTRLHELEVMRERVGETLPGTVAFVSSDSFTVRLDAPFVDVEVELAQFAAGAYELDGLGLRLVSRAGHSIGLGDRIDVRIVQVDGVTRRVLAVPKAFAEAADERGAARSPRRGTGRARSSAHESSGRPRPHSEKTRGKRPRRR